MHETLTVMYVYNSRVLLYISYRVAGNEEHRGKTAKYKRKHLNQKTQTMKTDN